MQWIECAKEMPKQCDKYLVYAPSADPTSPLIATVWYFTDDKGWYGLIDYWLQAITHWMPLPPPPDTEAEV